MTAAAGSNIGLRKDNEDRYYINENKKIFMIADGMGGHEHGQLASKLAVSVMAENVLQLEEPLSLSVATMAYCHVSEAIAQLKKEGDTFPSKVHVRTGVREDTVENVINGNYRIGSYGL